jgi:hypothetical protein
MSFCEHCQGQRFDRAQVLRALRQARTRLRDSNERCDADQAIALAIDTVLNLAIPHLELVDDVVEGDVIH